MKDTTLSRIARNDMKTSAFHRWALPATFLAMATAMMPSPCLAVWLWASESQGFVDLSNLDEWKIRKDFVTKDRTGALTLDFHESDPHNKKLITALSAGIPTITTLEVKRTIAEGLQAFSQYCDMDKLGVNLNMAPIPDISNRQVNVSDPRRITSFSIVGCLEKGHTPKACKYWSGDNNDTGMDLGEVLRIIRDCRTAVEDVNESHSDAVGKTDPSAAAGDSTPLPAADTTAQLENDNCPGQANCEFHATPTGSSFWYSEPPPWTESGDLFNQLTAVLQEPRFSLALKQDACRVNATKKPKPATESRQMLGNRQMDLAFWDYAFVDACCTDMGIPPPRTAFDDIADGTGVKRAPVCTAAGAVVQPDFGSQ